jgi:hypothetical protein
MFSRANRLDERINQLGGTESSQGHALHFLKRLKRADEDASRLALNLYHKPDALRFVLSWVKVPKDVSRAAISLSPEDNGPFIVTELDGKFVTCLGHKMGTDGLLRPQRRSVGMPPVPAGQVKNTRSVVWTSRISRSAEDKSEGSGGKLDA